MSGFKIYRFAIVFILLFFVVGFSYAIDDGFGPARKIEGKHFTIYSAPQLDISSLTQQLNIRAADKLISGGPLGRQSSSPGSELADMADTLFMRVCDILDMQLYSYQGNIKICQDYEQMNRIYNRLFDKSLHHQKSFYVYSLNTIYISSDNFKREVLGHEMAHAVISHYFVVLPSIKIQEVLATYIEYQLRKTE